MITARTAKPTIQRADELAPEMREAMRLLRIAWRRRSRAIKSTRGSSARLATGVRPMVKAMATTTAEVAA